MDVTDITAQLDQLDGDIDKLEEALKPLMSNLNDVASKLPLLDKAKLYVLAAYAIESALFCTITINDSHPHSDYILLTRSLLAALRLKGIDAKQHPVFKELIRTRQYFEKIKKAEEPQAQRTQTVNTQAAIRFIKADLADNQNQDMNTKLKEQLAKERAKAAVNAAKAKSQKRTAEDSAAESSKAEGPGDGSDDEEGEVQEPERKRAKKSRGKGDKSKSKRDKKKN